MIEDYLFHYNSTLQKWDAFTRDDQQSYWNDRTGCKSLITSANVNDIIKYLTVKNNKSNENKD